MKIHDLKLSAEPFNAIASGQKTIESRLYDYKRKKIELGDIIVFINREEPSQTLKVHVVGLLRYKTFNDLFSNHEVAKFGGTNKDRLIDQIREFYSDADEVNNGVIGIQFKLI
jgi:ASC-1-like (ASCH) protein